MVTKKIKKAYTKPKARSKAKNKEIDYGEALQKPFKDLKKAVIGIIISLIPIVNWIWTGYIVEMIRNESKGNNKLPEWNDWGKKFVDGLLLTIISIIYLIIALIFLVPGIVAFTQTNDYSVLGIGTGLGIILFVVLYYFLSGAIVNFAVKKKFGAAFDFRAIKKRIWNKSYFKAWFISSVIAAVISFVGVGLGMRFTVGAMFAISMVISAALSWITSIFFYTVIARAYNA